MKKISASILLITIITSLFATWSFADATKTYSLYELEQLMLKNNLDYIRVTETLEKETRNFTDAKTQADGVKSYDYKKEPYDNYDVEVKKNLNPIKAEKSFVAAKFDKTKTELKLKRDLKSSYQSLIYDMDLLESLNEEFTLMKKIHTSKEKELELGVISENAFMEFDKSYKSSYKSVLSQTNKVAKSKRELMILVGMPVSTSFEVSRIGFATWEYSTKETDEYVSEALDYSYQIKKLEIDKLVAERELAYKHRFAGFSDAKKEMETLNDQIEDLPRQIDNARNNVEYDILTKYNSVLIGKEDLDIAKITLDQAVRESGSSKIKFEQGLISEFNYVQAKNALIKSQNDFNNANLTFFLIVEEFKDYIDINTMEYKLESK